MRIEDYGLIGDLQSAALVGRNGSIDWLCLPRFDSPSCFTALLGDESHGRWLLAPSVEVTGASRRYRPGTLVLETDFETAEGTVRITDFMPRRGGRAPQVMRIVDGLSGRVPMRMELALRLDYGAVVPWVDRMVDGVRVQAGPDAFHLSTPLELDVARDATTAAFTVDEGDSKRFVLSWYPSYSEAPPVEDADSALARTDAFWREWSGRCSYDGEYRDAVLTSLIALKAMTDETTGAIVAAPTTSLPEDLGGMRNWDYRYCWLRDSVLTLNALLLGGYTEEALAFRDFAFRTGTGDPEKLQIMYGVGGERRLDEFELDWLPGYEGSRPVRVGNAASGQFHIGAQRLMAEGYGFGAEGDWKTAALVRLMKVMASGLNGGTSFMEDYTYHLTPGGATVLGAHMLEVCPTIAAQQPSCEIHPLAIGGKEDPVRLVFTAPPGPGVVAGLLDFGDRFRMVVNAIDVVSPEQDLPRLPVARALWQPRPDLTTAAEAWILAGAPHHTSFSQALPIEPLKDFAEMAGIECLVIDERTRPDEFLKELRWNQVYYHLANGV